MEPFLVLKTRFSFISMFYDQLWCIMSTPIQTWSDVKKFQFFPKFSFQEVKISFTDKYESDRVMLYHSSSPDSRYYMQFPAP